MADTNVPPITFGPDGFTGPSEPEILDGRQQDINTAFGGNLNPALNTPQGQLAVTDTAIIGQANATFLYYTQQVDPAYATGRMQDAIARIYFLERLPAEATVVQALCTGLEGVAIPAGSLAKADDGNLYTCIEDGVIPLGGAVTLPFTCNLLGPIPCPVGDLATIYQAIPGWDTITNVAEGVLGRNTETRSEFEARRAASVALNSRGSLPSIRAAVLAVSGVLDAYTNENDTAAPVTIGGFTLAPNSLYVAVAGGDDDDVAHAIWTRKAPGCAYNGNTTVAVEDTNPGLSPPYPSYNVTFERPSELAILFSVVILDSPQVPSNAVTLIQDAIIAAFAGVDGGTRARIGSTILASRFYAPVALLGPWALIQSLTIGSVNAPDAVMRGHIAGVTLTLDSVTSGAVAIGQTVVGPGVSDGTVITAGASLSWTVNNTQVLSGATFTGTGSGTNLTASAVTGLISPGDYVFGTGVPANTTIVSQTSGTPGGAGVYVTSAVTTSVGASLHTGRSLSGVVPNDNSVAVGIAQVPTVTADNIAVTLT